MQIRSFLTAFVFASSAGLLFAQITLDYQAPPGSRDIVLSSSLTPVPDGNEVRVGYFDTGFDLAVNAGNLELLLAHWHQFDSTTVTTIFGQPGRFADTATSVDPSFNNQKITLWMFKTSDNAAPSGDFSNVQQYGIFSSTASNWVFPTQGSVPPANSTLVSSSEVNQAFWGTIVGDASSGHLELASAVPEPEQWALLTGFLLVGFGVVRRLRREAPEGV